MSLHKSKGLSSPIVVIAGCVDGLLPAEPEQGTSTAERHALLEEQRRLFYVGITRVKAAPSSNRPGPSADREPDHDASPAHAVRGPKHVVKTGKTTVLTGEQARELLDSIDTSTLVGLRDRALISVMTFAFAQLSRAEEWRRPRSSC